MPRAKIKCLIVDDEPPALRILEAYVAKIDFLELCFSGTKPLEALAKIEEGGIDLAFMDIQMPELTGIQLSKIVKEKTSIIFTTAYPQFALESYDLNALDYLLKPIEFSRFYEAVNKFSSKQTLDEKPSTEVKNSESSSNHLFVKTDGKNNFERIVVSEIQWIEAMKNYVVIHSRDGKIVTHSTLKNMEESLPQESFVQTHKSFIVAINQIEKTDSLSVYIGEKAIPIGDTFRKTFFSRIGDKSL